MTEVDDLHVRLVEAEDILRAIRDGEVDALVVAGSQGDEIHFLGGGDHIFRQFIETVNEGTATVSADGDILGCDAGLAKTLGCTIADVVGTPIADHVSPADRETLNMVLSRTGTGASRRRVCLIARDGRLVPVYLSASVLRDAAAREVSCLVFADMEEIVSAEETLRESEERYRQLVTLAPVGIAVFSEGRIVFLNATGMRMLGADSESQVIGRPIEEIVHPDGLETTQSRIRRMVSGEQGLYPSEVICLRLDGTPIDVELTATPVWYGDSAAVQAIVIDITERKKNARRLERTTRALLTLSACNAVLVRANDEESLLQGVCDSAIAQGSYRMAWVGYAEHDDAKRVRPVAFAGHEDGYLSEMPFSWGDDAATGVCGLAIQKRESLFVRDIQTDTRFLHIREATLARGYRSVAALPLVDRNGAAIGAFMLIAAEPDAFDTDEMKLLEELASDLSFGIESLRSDVRRSEAEHGLVAANEHLANLLVRLTEMVGRVVETRDPYTHGHEERSALIAVALAHEMGLADSIVESVRVAALMHDVGKMVVPAEILSKPGKLSEAEFSLIKAHPLAGYDILKDIPFEWPIAEIVLQHHERMDGSGYPNGLQGDQILIEARILAVADVVEAMASHRPYRPALGLDFAVAEITSGSGKYDPMVVRACQSLYDAGLIQM